ncbi:DUF4129 domain-containing protein [Cohnella caldifontis]|uniref:DUF4129 domain-containing protein n=1 Tax=Cohnella caldifontis TaxID=3027471 RepID=UPI0023EA8D5F|nr:DUF4129 domain-containing protein [Cohnella sp. YIM B05605]
MAERSDFLEDKRRLGEILSRDEYTAYLQDHGGHARPHASVWTWLWDKAAGLFPSARWPEGAASAATYALLGAVLIALCGAIYWFSRQVAFQREAKRRKALVGPSEIAMTYEQYAAMAKQAKSEGRIRESIRCSFLSLLFLMEHEGWIRIENWKTDWDYRDELERNRANAVPLFQRNAVLFERVWYGNEPADEDSFLAIQRDIDALAAVREAR